MLKISDLSAARHALQGLNKLSPAPKDTGAVPLVNAKPKKPAKASMAKKGGKKGKKKSNEESWPAGAGAIVGSDSTGSLVTGQLRDAIAGGGRLNKLHKELGAKGLVVLGASMDEDG